MIGVGTAYCRFTVPDATCIEVRPAVDPHVASNCVPV
jgi:hypothetical protein